MERDLFEMEQTVSGFRIRIVNASGNTNWEYFTATSVQSITGVEVVGMGTRDANTNQRKMPLREDDERNIVISFTDHEKPASNYNIKYINNHWKILTLGLQQVVAQPDHLFILEQLEMLKLHLWLKIQLLQLQQQRLQV